MSLNARLTDPHNTVDGTTLHALNEKLSNSMTKLFRLPKNGGNPFLFALTVSKPHVLLDDTLPGYKEFNTAATDGKTFFWSKTFLEILSEDELPTVMMHESYHVLFFHSDRMVGAHKKVRNWVMDYVVNSNIEKDHIDTGRPGQLWGGNLGNPIAFKDLLEVIDGKQDWGKKGEVRIFADVSVYGRSPEEMYDEVMAHWKTSPRLCKTCNSLSIDPMTGLPVIPKPWDPNGCTDCGAIPDSSDGMGNDGIPKEMDCLDSHIKTIASKHEVQSEAMKAAQQAQMMRGTVPSGVEEMLGELIKPTLKFTDIIRNACFRKQTRDGLQNDWKRFRRRWMAASVKQYLPQRHSHKPRWLAMLDTSGSMSEGDMVYGVSQLKSLDKSGTEGYVVCCDAQVHWKSLTRVEKADDLKKVDVVGRGGTVFNTFFEQFPKEVGKDWDCIVIITDGDCGDIPMNLRPPIDVVWVLTRKVDFRPTFGRVVPLRNEKM